MNTIILYCIVWIRSYRPFDYIFEQKKSTPVFIGMAETARPAGRGSWFRRTLAIGQLPDWRRASEGESTELQDHRYDPERPWRYAFAWREGVLRPLLQRGDFWVIFAASIGLRVLMTSLDVDTGLEHMVDDVPQFAQLITFLLIFYNGVCYQRFLDAYRMTNECAVSTMALVAASVGALRSATSSHNLARYSLTLFHLAVYEGRGAVSWDTLTVRRLLSEEEVGALRERGGDCTSDTVLAWAFEEVRPQQLARGRAPAIAGEACGAACGRPGRACSLRRSRCPPAIHRSGAHGDGGRRSARARRRLPLPLA